MNSLLIMFFLAPWHTDEIEKDLRHKIGGISESTVVNFVPKAVKTFTVDDTGIKLEKLLLQMLESPNARNRKFAESALKDMRMYDIKLRSLRLEKALLERAM